jgi:putative pyrroloquinoline-quinone binding quinoprotein
MGALVGVACAGCAAEAAPSPSAKQLADVPAWDVVAVAGKMVVVDDGFLSVTALDAATGAVAWTTKVQAAPANGAHGLLVNGASALAWFGERAHVLDGATGAKRTSYATVLHASGCGLWVKEGICARVCQCSFALADCTTGQILSANYKGKYVEMIDHDGGMSSGCWGFDGWPLGVAGKLAMISVDDPKPHVAGVDPATKKEVWHRDMSASPQTYETGHSADGKTCWFSDRDKTLVVLDCATGTQLWTSKGVPGSPRHFVVQVAGRGLFEQKVTTATLYEERTGRVVWSLGLPAAAVAWPKGTAPTMGAIGSLDKATSVVLLDPSSGKALATVAIPKGADVIPDAGGAFFVADSSTLVAYDAAGVETARASVPAINMELGSTLIAMGRDPDVVVVDKKTLRDVLRVPGPNLSFVVEGALGTGRFVVFQYDAKHVGRARLYAVP